MALPQRQPEPTGAIWAQGLPRWIAASEDYAAMPSSLRRTLQAIADAGDRADSAGNITNAWGGSALAARVGCCVRTLQRHVSRLEAAGFVVCLRVGSKIDGVVMANVYGIPGVFRGLDHRRVSRPMVRQVRVEGELSVNGRQLFRPVKIEANDQLALWCAEGGATTNCRTPLRQNVVPPTTNCRTPLRQNVVLPYPSPSPNHTLYHPHPDAHAPEAAATDAAEPTDVPGNTPSEPAAEAIQQPDPIPSGRDDDEPAAKCHQDMFSEGTPGAATLPCGAFGSSDAQDSVDSREACHAATAARPGWPEAEAAMQGIGVSKAYTVQLQAARPIPAWAVTELVTVAKAKAGSNAAGYFRTICDQAIEQDRHRQAVERSRRITVERDAAAQASQRFTEMADSDLQQLLDVIYQPPGSMPAKLIRTKAVAMRAFMDELRRVRPDVFQPRNQEE